MYELSRQFPSMSIVAGWPETWSAEQDKRRKYGTKFAVIP